MLIHQHKKQEDFMIKKILLIGMVLMAFSFGSLIWANGEEDAGGDSFLIGGAMYDLGNKFHTYIEDAMKQFDAEYDDVEFTFTDAKADASLQISQIETLITRGVDSIVIVPVEPANLGQVIDKCEEAGVKLVVANLIPNDKDLERIDAYIGSKSIDAGLIQAEYVAEALSGEGNVAILIGDLGLEVSRMRTKGNTDIFDKFPGIKVTKQLEGKWDRGKALTIVENWLQADVKNELDAIVCNNDEMAIGAYLAASQIGRDDLIIAGIDATPVALEYLGEGLDVTVFQSGQGQGYGAAELAYKAIKGEAVEKLNWIPFKLVTPDMRDEYLKKWE